MERLEERDCPAIYTHDGYVVGASFGGEPFTDYRGTLNTAAVEITTAQYRLAVAAGEGGGPRVQVSNPQGFQTFPAVFDDFVFDPSFRGGVRIALGDLNGDGNPDLVVVPGVGGGPQVKVYDGTDFHQISSFLAYDPDFRGGLDVAIANGQIVTVPGKGGGPNVRTFNSDGTLISSVIAGNPDDRAGSLVATGDVVAHDGVDDVVVLTSGTLTTIGVSSIQVGPATALAVGYFTNPLLPKVTTSSGSDITEWDVNPLFPTGRMIASYDYSKAYGHPVTFSLGTVRQEDGVPRFLKTGGYLDTDFESLQYPLGGALKPAPGGAAIGPVNDNQTGTLTGYVTGPDGTVYALTNRHVVAIDEVPTVGEPMRQPGAYFGDDGRAFGVVSAIGVNVDSALIRLNDQTDYDPRYGYTQPDGSLGYLNLTGHTELKVGDLAYKFGFWGVSMGLVVATNATASVRYGTAIITFSGITVIAGVEAGLSFVIPGDSGSMVTNYNGVRTAQVFAGNNSVGIVTPLTAVLHEFGVSLL